MASWKRARTDRQTVPGLVVSMTTFPDRNRLAKKALLSIACQSISPERTVLVLSRTQYCEARLPRPLRSLQGVEILWTDNDLGSYKKLIPTAQRYPFATIVTVDDDFWYHSNMLAQLIEATSRFPEHIVGHRARRLEIDSGRLLGYETWPLANTRTSPSRVFITTGGGTAFPPSATRCSDLTDAVRASASCPTADDVWFWAASIACGIPSICISDEFPATPLAKRPGRPTLFSINTSLAGNDYQLARAIGELGIRIEALEV